MRIGNSDRVWMIGGAFAGLVVLALGWFFLISPQNSQTADLHRQADDARTRAMLLQSKLNHLRKQNENLAQYKAELARYRLALPATAGLPDFLRDLQAASAATHVAVTGVSVASPVAVTGGQSSSSSAGSTSSGGSASAPASSAYALPITLTAGGGAAQLDAFVRQIQQIQPRAVLITSVSEAAGTTAGVPVTLTISMRAFVAPSTAQSSTKTN